MRKHPVSLENQRLRPAVLLQPSRVYNALYSHSPFQQHKHPFSSLTTLQVHYSTQRSQIQSPKLKQGRRRRDGWCSEGVVDGGDKRGRRGGTQGPGRSLPLELRDQVHPPGSQGQRPRRYLAGQEAAFPPLLGGEGRGGAEDGDVPQLLGTQLVATTASYRCSVSAMASPETWLVTPHCNIPPPR
uniref:Uncharacterized protein n=1 Tax=Avena sativa TaxID=4498 RepID=A0ACD5V1X6_AVESA